MISAVGHEPDVTISDFVADVRAATPSNAAELAVPDRDALIQTMDAMSVAMATALKRQLQASRRHLSVLAQSNCLKSPIGYLKQRREAVGAKANRLAAAHHRVLNLRRQGFVSLTAKLDAMSPLKVLTRGYAMAQTSGGALLSSVSQVQSDDNIQVALKDGLICATVNKIMEAPYESAE